MQLGRIEGRVGGEEIQKVIGEFNGYEFFRYSNFKRRENFINCSH